MSAEAKLEIELEALKEPSGQDRTFEPPAQGLPKLDYRDRAMLLFSEHVAPRIEIWIVCCVIALGVLLIWRGSLVSALIGFFLLMGSLIFLSIIGHYRTDTLSVKDAETFLDLYYSHPMGKADRPNARHMSSQDMLKHVGRCIESVPEKRRELLGKFPKAAVRDWEGPVRDWVTDYYNRRDARSAVESKKGK
jgi:hypothetical protein